MKTLFLLLMLAVSASAQVPTTNQPLTFYQACFGGIDNYHDSARIDNCDFQDGRNFLTYKGYLEKRPGSFRVSEGLKPGYPITYQKEFINVSNTDLFIVQSGTQIFSSDFGSAFVEIATVNVNGVTDSLSAFGKHFFVNGYDTPWYTTGVDHTHVPEMPTGCKLLAFDKERIWCGNAAGYESTLYASAFGNYADWTITPTLTADSPMSWAMDAQDGKPLTCVYTSPYGVLAWKRNKTFVVKGFDNDDFYKFRLSENIGCVDQRSVQLVDGRVTWLGEDGVYQWAGGNETPKLVSRDIDATIKRIRQNTANAGSRLVTTPEEFTNGAITNNGPSKSWSTTIAQGSIVPSTWSHTDTDGADWAVGTLLNVSTSNIVGSVVLSTPVSPVLFENFSDGNYSSSPPWTFGGAYDKFSVSNGKLIYQLPDSISVPYTGYVYASTSTTNWGNWWIDLNVWNAGNTGNGDNIVWYYFISSSYLPTSTNGYGIRLESANAAPTGPYNMKISLIKVINGTESILTSKTSQIPSYSNNYTACTGLKIYVSQSGIFTISTGTYDGAKGCDLTYTDSGFSVGYSSYNILSASGRGTAPDVYTNSFDNIYVPAGYNLSGSFTSQIFDTTFSTPIGGPFSFSDNAPVGSTIAYSVRDSSTSILPTWSNWLLVNPPTSGTYRIPLTKEHWQYKADFSTSYSTQTPMMQEVTLIAASTGTWDSEVLFTGTAMTSWGQFNAVVNQTNPSNTLFYTRAAQTVFTQDATLPAWVVQPNGLNVTASTGAYVQARVVSNIGSSSDTAQVDSITFNWYEGEVKSVASLYFDKNYYLAVNISSMSTSNETTLMLQRTGKWTILEGLSYGTLGMYNLQPYAGSGLTDSKIWRIMNEGTFYDDNDKAINAYVITKDFQFDGQNNNKLLRQFYLESFPTTTGTLSMAYSVDKSTTYVTTDKNLVANTMFNDEVKGMFPGYAKGRYVKFKFSNAVVNEYFKLDAYTIFGEYEKLYRR